MSSHVNSNVVVRFDPPIANIYEESDENESDVEYDARSYARLGNQLIHRPANVVILNWMNFLNNEVWKLKKYLIFLNALGKC